MEQSPEMAALELEPFHRMLLALLRVEERHFVSEKAARGARRSHRQLAQSSASRRIGHSLGLDGSALPPTLTAAEKQAAEAAAAAVQLEPKDSHHFLRWACAARESGWKAEVGVADVQQLAEHGLALSFEDFIHLQPRLREIQRALLREQKGRWLLRPTESSQRRWDATTNRRLIAKAKT